MKTCGSKTDLWKISRFKWQILCPIAAFFELLHTPYLCICWTFCAVESSGKYSRATGDNRFGTLPRRNLWFGLSNEHEHELAPFWTFILQAGCAISEARLLVLRTSILYVRYACTLIQEKIAYYRSLIFQLLQLFHYFDTEARKAQYNRLSQFSTYIS